MVLFVLLITDSFFPAQVTVPFWLRVTAVNNVGEGCLARRGLGFSRELLKGLLRGYCQGAIGFRFSPVCASVPGASFVLVVACAY